MTPKRRAAEAAAALRVLHRRAALFAALADPNRLALLTVVINQPGITNADAVTAQNKATTTTPLAQATVSYHLLRLARVGLVTQDKRGTFVHHTATELAVKLMAVQP